MKTIAQIAFTVICIATTSLSEAQDQPASTVLSLKTADERFRDLTEQYRELVIATKSGSGAAWKLADDLSRKASKSDDAGIHIAAIAARKAALEEKLIQLADIVDMEESIKADFEKLKVELDTRIQSYSARLEETLQSKALDISDLSEAVELTKRVEELLGTEESILQMLESQQLSDAEAELVNDFSQEVKALMTTIKLARQSESTQQGLLKELNLLRLTRSLEHLEMLRGVKQSRLAKRNLARLLRNDGLMLETISIQKEIRESLGNGIPLVEIALDDLVPDASTTIPKGVTSEEILSRQRKLSGSKPKTGPSSTEIQQFLDSNNSNFKTGEKQ